MQRLDGIWGAPGIAKPRAKAGVTILRRFGAAVAPVWPRIFFGKVARALPITPIVRVVVVAVVASSMLLGLTQPAVSQTVDLARLIKPGNYLLAFLNSAELRPSGGFLGSFALVHYDGQSVHIDVETNIYKKDNQFLNDHFVPLPKQFGEVWGDKSMSLVNANFEPDFANSAQVMLNYYQAEYGGKLDGVIGLTVLPVLDLMGEVGPVDLPTEKVSVTRENFLHTLHQLIQVDYFKTPENRVNNEPKAVLAELVAQMPDRVAKVPKKTIWQMVDKTLKEKNLLFYFSDSRQTLAESHGWAGRLQPGSGDYLAIYNANYGGGKTSLEIDEEVKLEKLSPRLRRLTVTRSHPGGDDEFNRGENRNYIELFVPKGASLRSAKRSGQLITGEVDVVEDQFTRFGFWLTTQPFSAQVASIEYEIPEALEGLTIVKQPGTRADTLLVLDGNQVVFSGNLNYDLQLR